MRFPLDPEVNVTDKPGEVRVDAWDEDEVVIVVHEGENTALDRHRTVTVYVTNDLARQIAQSLVDASVNAPQEVTL